MEQYVSDHSQAQFTHGICPECEEKLYAKLAELEDELAQDAEAS